MITKWQVVSRRGIAVGAWLVAAVLVVVWIKVPAPSVELPLNYWLLLALNLFNFGVVASTTYRKLDPFLVVLGATAPFLFSLWASSAGWFTKEIVLAAPDWLTLIATVLTGIPAAVEAELFWVWRCMREIDAFDWPA